MEFKKNRECYAQTCIKTVRLFVEWWDIAIPEGVTVRKGPAGVWYQIQRNEFVDQQPLQCCYHQQYSALGHPLHPGKTPEQVFQEAMDLVEPRNLTHPQLIYAYLESTPPIRRGQVLVVEARDPAPLLLIDAAVGGGLGYGGWSASNVYQDWHSPKQARARTPEFWHKQIFSQEELDGRPRVRRYRE